MTRQEAVRLIEELFDTWYPCLFRYLLRATGSVELAEDMAQEAFMNLYQELARGRAVDSPRAWTLCVARRHLQRHLRRHMCGRRDVESLEALEDLPAAGWTPGDWTQFEEIVGLFSGLSRREEEALLLRLEGLKYREIAARLGISPNTVPTLLIRALAKLKARVRADSGVARPSDAVGKRARTTLQ